MRSGTRLALPGLVASITLLACGGGGGDGGTLNPFLGTVSITSALPAGNTACLATHDVTFSGAGANIHQVSAAGGDCLRFTNTDTAQHQPFSIPTSGGCPELRAPVPLAQNGVFTTPPLGGPGTCNWQDLLNPPTAGGGGGGGGGY